METSTSSKVCPKCLQEQPLENFRQRQRSEDSNTKRFYTNCKSCEREINSLLVKLKKEHPQTSNVCGCCGKEAKLYLDHCHDNKSFRGWICNNCNVGLSRLGDNIEGLTKALNYLIERR